MRLRYGTARASSCTGSSHRDGLDCRRPWQDIRHHTAAGVAKITINRPEVRNALRPTTLVELSQAFERARNDPGVGVIILPGGPGRLPGEAISRLRQVPAPAVTAAPAHGRREWLDLWVQGARPRTLGTAVVAVVVGAAASAHVAVGRTVLALVVALALQMGVNYANDYSDGIRGVDAVRVGPLRLTASGLVPARSVALAAGIALLVAALAGTVLSLITAPWLLGVGAACLMGAIGYSGGSRPYASRGLGELAVFVFFGPVAVCGTAYINVARVPPAAWWAAVPVGLVATALLVVNNLRDIPGDAAVGKRTLAVRLGARRTATLYSGLVAGAVLVPLLGVALGGLPLPTLLVLAAAPLAIAPVRSVHRDTGAALIPTLVATARFQLVAGALLSTGLLWGR